MRTPKTKELENMVDELSKVDVNQFDVRKLLIDDFLREVRLIGPRQSILHKVLPIPCAAAIAFPFPHTTTPMPRKSDKQRKSSSAIKPPLNIRG